MKYRDRQFVWTWWAGLVRDTFAPGSVFRVARFGGLRIGRSRGSCRSERRPTADRFDGAFLLVHIRDCLPLGGLLTWVVE